MASWETLLAFALATAITAYFPGPALLYTAAQTLAHGRRAGYMAMLGIHLGCYLHVIAAAFGLSAIFAYAPALYTVLKLAGAAYLIWLGVNLFRARLEVPNSAKPAKPTQRALIDSFIVEALNPKVALFFIALLPQFVDPAGSLPVWAQFLILGVIVNFAFSSADLVAVLGASAVLKRIRTGQSGLTVARMLGGTALVGLGLRLAWDR